jgi:uncharacterized protein
MLAAIEGMITELRELGVPVSLAERVDAVQSLQHLPVGDRNTVKAALRSVLVKNHDHELAFDTVFDVYFAAEPAPPALARATGQGRGSGQGAAGSGGAPGQGAGSGGLGGEGAGGSGVLGSMDDAGCPSCC